MGGDDVSPPIRYLLECEFDAFAEAGDNHLEDWSFQCVSDGQDWYSPMADIERVYPYTVKLVGRFDELTGYNKRIVSFSQARLTIELSSGCVGAHCPVEGDSLSEGAVVHEQEVSGMWRYCKYENDLCPQ